MITRAKPLPAEHPLAGCVEKVWRAHDHFKLLQKEVGEVAARGRKGEIDFARFRDELHPDPKLVGRWTCRTTVAEVYEPPLRFATIIGDVVHNLRSSLDHLVFELAFLGMRGKKVPGRVAYPCSLTQQNWRSGYVQDALLAGVMQKHRAMIYRTQPCYRRKDTPTNPRTLSRRKRHALADLENLWKHDKHRMLQPVFLAPYEIKPRIGPFINCRTAGEPRLNLGFLGRPLEVGTAVLTVPLRETGGEQLGVRVNLRIAAELGFRNGIPVLKALAYMGDTIPHILERFRPEFETPTARKLWGLPRGGWIEAERIRKPRTRVVGWTRETIPSARDSPPGASTET